MSHYTVAVITDDPDKLEDLMAPYQENNMGDCPQEYMTFNDVEEECKMQYETGTISRIQLENGEHASPSDDIFRVEYEPGHFRYVKPEHLEEIEVSYKEVYPTLDDFITEYHEYERDSITGKYGHWENPNSKWDWYSVGGRWSDMLTLRNGNTENIAQIKDVFFFHPDSDVAPSIDAILNREFDMAAPVNILGVNVPANLASDIQKSITGIEKQWDEALSGKSFYRPEYFLERYKTKEDYVKESLEFGTYAVITPDGNWHSKGDMGWFGASSESAEEAKEFQESFYDRFIKSANPEHYLIVVDCHI